LAPIDSRRSGMVDAANAARPRRKGNALNWLIGLFFGVAALCAAAPVLVAPVTAASLMLLVGLAGVACLGLLALRNPAEPAGDPELSPEALLQSLPEPTALAAADGRIHACNGAWRGSVGMAPRPPK